MDLKTLQHKPPWDWPRDARKKFQKIQIDHAIVGENVTQPLGFCSGFLFRER